MSFTFREFSGEADRPAMARLVEQNPARSIHVLDMPYRLASPSLDDPRSVGLWQNENGELAGFAVIQWPWQTLDLVCVPTPGNTLEQQILDWAIERFPQISRDYLSYEHPLLFIDVPQHDYSQIAFLEQNGFRKHDWQTTHFLKSLAGDLLEIPLPPGFTLRPISSAAEYVKIHETAFEYTSMTIPWRERVERMPSYRPELNVAVVAPDGEVVAFCSGWLGRVDAEKLVGADTSKLAGQIEPMGVAPAYRGRKLGRAALQAVFRQMKNLGVEKVIVETDNFRDDAQNLYRAAGFEEKYIIYKYCREF